VFHAKAERKEHKYLLHRFFFRKVTIHGALPSLLHYALMAWCLIKKYLYFHDVVFC